MKTPGQPQRFAILATLAALMLATATLAHDGVTNRGVLKRMQDMNAARATLGVLSDMMGARAQFDKLRAKAARKRLIATTRAIPSRFRRPQSDPQSYARATIWTRWDDFRARARTAKRAASALDVDSLGDLRVTLPGLVMACLECHKVYRAPFMARP